MDVIKTDCLVIGSGLSGLTAALELAKNGIEIILATRTDDPSISNTYYAQGGIIFTSPNDSPTRLKSDILSVGDEICNPRAVDILVEEGPKLVERILIGEVGIGFDKEKDKESFDLTEEGGHSLRRIIHIADHTGKAIEDHFLRHVCANNKVRLMTRVTALDLLTLSHHSVDPLDTYKEPTCVGAYFYDQTKRKVFAVVAKVTILATGGLGQIYLHTSNPEGARGDGFTMAARSGANLLNMEYVQFHPTTLYSKSSERFLISESMRGEGARLLNPKMEEFMHLYHENGSLAPRDIVSRAIHEEMLKFASDYVYLDISFKQPEWVRKRFPHIYRKCLEEGYDITKAPVPIVPAAHYACGGVAVDDLGRTSIKNLRAVGEVSCTGVHGANRLASTSLLEALVWGSRTGSDVLRSINVEKFYIPGIKDWRYEMEECDPALIRQDWLMLKHTMWNYVGLVRTSKRLDRATSILNELAGEVDTFYAKSELTDALIGLRNGVKAASIVLNAARKNRKSRGCHFIKD